MAPRTMTLLVRPCGHQYQWHDGHTGASGTLDALQAAATGRRLILALPGDTLLLTRAMAPRRNRTAWRQALPYALEDQLATEVERLHFALGRTADRPRAADGTAVPVAVIERETLREYLEPLQAAGLNPQAAVPEILLLPLPENGWSLLADTEQTLVRTGPYSGFATESDNLPPMLTLALQETADPPSQLAVYGQTPALPDAELTVTRHPLPEQRLSLLHRGLTATPPLNLLQGHFGPSASLQRWLRPWRTAAILTGLLLGATLVGSGVEYRQLNQQRNTLEQTIEQVFRQAVPDVQRIVNPRAQLSNRLRELSGPGGDDGEFLSLLAYSGEVLSEFPDLSLRALRFRAGRLEFDLEGGSLEQLEQLQARLRRDADHTVQLQASMREDRVVSRLTVDARTS